MDLGIVIRTIRCLVRRIKGVTMLVSSTEEPMGHASNLFETIVEKCLSTLYSVTHKVPAIQTLRIGIALLIMCIINTFTFT